MSLPDAAGHVYKVASGRALRVHMLKPWTCQRGVRFESWMMICTLHDGYHLFDDVLLFDLDTDPHEQHNLASRRPDIVEKGMGLLKSWEAEMLPTAARGRDPLVNVVKEGGPYHVRGKLRAYLERLRETGREAKADALALKYAEDLQRPAEPGKPPFPVRNLHLI